MPGRKRVNVPKGATATHEGRRPKLGQHFLASPPAAQRIVASLGDLSASTVLEIGPGRGALTDLLASKARRVIAVELDRVLAAQLRMQFAMRSNVEIIEGDILKIELDTIFGPKPGSLRPGMNFAPEPAHVIGNLPYYITSDILLRLFDYHRYFSSIAIMVQKEVADRLAASPGSRDYGLLSATAQLYGRVEKLFTLPPGAFAPPPKVHSSVVRMVVEPRIASLQVPEREFISFLKLCFGQKRKTLLNNLKSQFEKEALQRALTKIGLKTEVRSEALSLEKSAAVFRALRGEQSAEVQSPR